MVDEPSSLGEAEMLGTGSIEHRELIYYTVSKSTTFGPPRAGPRPVRLNGLRPAGLVHNYTNTHATYSNAPWAWARLVPQCLVNLSRPPAVATTRPPGGLSWVISSPALTGAGANHPPVMGGQLTFDALVDA